MTGWDKFDSITKAVSAVLIPAAIAYAGQQYALANTERVIEAKFVELGVSILQTPPGRANENLRAWATKVLDKYSGVAISEGAQDDLRKIPLPPTGGLAPSSSLQLYCACYAGQTFCAFKESDCLNTITGRPCTIRYVDKELFDISDATKWSRYREGWIMNKCIL